MINKGWKPEKTKTRSRATKLLDTLTDIRTLIELEQTLNDLLQRSEYTEAIKLMESCKKISSNFSKFPCCIKISNRLSDTSKMAINNLDEVLSQQTIRYDQDRFRSLLEGKVKRVSKRYTITYVGQTSRRQNSTILYLFETHCTLFLPQRNQTNLYF